jgi:RHS repeat-associated protein
MKKIVYSGTTDYVEFTYDAAGRRTALLDTRLPSSDLGGQTYSWAYDINDRVTTETWPGGSTIVTGYDKLGRRTSLRDPDGNVTAYNYSSTATNRKLVSIQHPFSGRTSYSYDAKGLLWAELPEGMGCELDIGTRYEYDSLNRVSAIRHLQCEDTPAYHREAYTYNAASMRTRIDVEKANGGSMLMPDSHKLYKYDALLRLTEEHKRRAGDNVSLYRFAYNYDAAGNRTQLVNFTGATTQTTTYQYNNGNQLTSYGGPWTDGYSFAYDLNGNQINKWFEDDHTVTNHNRENRLTSVYRTVTGHTVSYTYDALGRRIMRTDPQGNKVRYWYDGLGTLLTKEKPSGSSAWRTKQVCTLKQAALGHIISERTNTAWNAQGAATAWGDKWLQFDLLGNTTAELDSGGSVITQVDMEAFGTVLSGGQNGYRLTTKQYDPDAGLYYFNSRWYDNWVRGFLEMDSLWGPPYLFCDNAPSVYADPTGLYTVEPNCPGASGAQKIPEGSACLSTLSEVKDPKMQKFIEAVLNDKTTLVDCSGKGCDPGDKMHKGQLDKNKTGFPDMRHTIFVCPGGLAGCSLTDYCRMVFHEIAHMNGFKAKHGNGGDPKFDGIIGLDGKGYKCGCK